MKNQLIEIVEGFALRFAFLLIFGSVGLILTILITAIIESIR